MKKVFSILFLMFLVGCSTLNKKPETIITSKKVLIIPPEILLSYCDVTKPINKDTFLQSTNEEQKIQLTNLTISLYGDLKKCNESKEGLKQWYLEQGELYK